MAKVSVLVDAYIFIRGVSAPGGMSAKRKDIRVHQAEVAWGLTQEFR